MFRVDSKGMGNGGKIACIIVYTCIYTRCWFMITSMLLFMIVLNYMLLYKSRFCKSKFSELQKHSKYHWHIDLELKVM